MYVSGSEAVSVDLPAQILRSAREAIVGETIDGTVVIWNRAAEELYGYPAAEMMGQRSERLCPPERRVAEAAALRRVAGGERLGEFVSERVRRDGTPVRVRVRASPILDGAGAPIGVATTSWAAEADPAPAPVLAGRTGHELRTPLNAILGFTGTLLMGLAGPLNDEQEHQLRLVHASAEQLLSRINQLSR